MDTRTELGIFRPETQPETASKSGTRRSNPKVRTGCVTCRKRRVKCGEEKPSCKRCLKLGRKCEGYQHVILASSYSANAKPLLQKAAKLYRQPSKNLFNNDEEYYCFRHFCTDTVVRLNSCWEWDVWNTVVLQTSQTNGFIRRAVTAIGALNFNAWADGVQGIHKTRREFAYREYSLAIDGLRRATAAGWVDIITKPLACILFALFETYHGNNEMATAQVFAAAEMVAEHEKESNERHRYSTKRLPPINEGIRHVLGMLEVQSTMYNDNRSNNYHLERMHSTQGAFSMIPAEFSTLAQARKSLSIIMMSNFHWRLSKRDQKPIRYPPLLGLEPSANKQTHFQVCQILARCKKWNAAFLPLLRRARSSNSKTISKAAALTRIHYLGCYLWLAAAETHSPELYYRHYTNDLLEIVDVAKSLTQSPSESLTKETFSFDSRIILPLIVVGWNFRHRAARKEVIGIFSKLKRREGIWDSVMTGKVMEWLVDIEEDGLGDEEYVPEQMAAKIVDMKIDTATRITRVSASQQDKLVPGKILLREAIIQW